MNLDDPRVFDRLDSQRTLASVRSIPEDLETGWQEGLTIPLPDVAGVERVALYGQGEPASAVDVLAAFAAPAAVPVLPLEEGVLPGWARGAGTLALCLTAGPGSTGSTGAAEALRERGCRLVELNPTGEPGSFAFDSGRLLAVFNRLGLLPGVEAEVEGALRALRAARETLLPETPVARNPAKRMAGQLVGRWVVVFGPGLLAPVARRWQMLLNAQAKTLAQSETLPAALRASPGGLNHPEALLSQVIALFLQAPSLPGRSRARLEYTREVYRVLGMNTDAVDAGGDTRLAHLWTLLQFGAYSALYLAAAYAENPAPAGYLAEMEEALDAFRVFEDEMG